MDLKGRTLKITHTESQLASSTLLHMDLQKEGRDYNTVDMSERQLREYYLPAYKVRWIQELKYHEFF